MNKSKDKKSKAASMMPPSVGRDAPIAPPVGSRRRDGCGSRVVLVGTYKSDQLTKWRGWYNYPISDEDFSRVEHVDSVRAAPQNSQLTTQNLQLVNELWLFKGTKGICTAKKMTCR